MRYIYWHCCGTTLSRGEYVIEAMGTLAAMLARPSASIEVAMRPLTDNVAAMVDRQLRSPIQSFADCAG